MGIEFSLLNMIGSGFICEIRKETKTDGTVVETKKCNPVVTGIIVTFSLVALIRYLNGGTSALSKIFSRELIKDS